MKWRVHTGKARALYPANSTNIPIAQRSDPSLHVTVNLSHHAVDQQSPSDEKRHVLEREKNATRKQRLQSLNDAHREKKHRSVHGDGGGTSSVPTSAGFSEAQRRLWATHAEGCGEEYVRFVGAVPALPWPVRWFVTVRQVWRADALLWTECEACVLERAARTFREPNSDRHGYRKCRSSSWRLNAQITRKIIERNV